MRAALRRARQLRDVSPLTGLPGNFEITCSSSARCVGRALRLIHADLDSFKAFNDHYGFLRGDDAIMATADVLTGVLGEHAGRGVLPRPCRRRRLRGARDPDQAEPFCVDAIAGFDRMAPSLYDDDDVERGLIEVDDRRNHRHEVGFMTISFGVAPPATGRC